MPRITVNNCDMSYTDTGSGPPLVLVHGLGGEGAVWTAQVPFFSKSFRVIVPDLRGHGESQVTDGGYDLPDQAKDIHELFTALELSGIYLCGESMGGMIALHYALDHQENLAALILCGTDSENHFHPAQIGEFQTFIEMADSGRLAEVVDQMILRAYSPEFVNNNTEQVDLIRRRASLRSGKAFASAGRAILARLSLTPHLHEIHVPALVMSGAADQLMPLEYSRAMHAALPNSTFAVLPNCGHVPMVEQPMLFNRRLGDFLTLQLLARSE